MRSATIYAAAVLSALAACPTFASPVAIPGCQPPGVVSLTASAPVSSSMPISVAVALPFRNQAALTALIKNLYDPNSPQYRQYLTSSQFNAEFAPTASDYANLSNYLTSKGLKITGTSANRKIIDVTGTAATINAAFQTTIANFNRPDGTTFYAAATAPSVDSSVSPLVESITGLDNANPPKPMYVEKPINAPAVGAHTAVAQQQGSGVGGGFSPSDVRTAYNTSGLDGSGQNLDLIEFGPWSPSDIITFAHTYGVRVPPITTVLLDGVSGGGTPSAEDTLDIDVMIDYCPNMNDIIVYEGNSVLDVLNRAASDNSARVLSISYGWSGGSGEYNTENSIYQQMAAQGMSVFVASGDSGSWGSGSLTNPADQPYVTSVGGTSLFTNGAGGSFSYETAWSGGGGGVSPYWGLPWYQNGVSGLASGSNRNCPDVSMAADPNTGYSVYVNGGWSLIGGTSAAAPAWACAIAIADQMRASFGQGAMGFINPSIYNFAQGPDYSQDLRDVWYGGNGGFGAVHGYDCATGWGSPIIGNLSLDLSWLGTDKINSLGNSGLSLQNTNDIYNHDGAGIDQVADTPSGWNNGQQWFQVYAQGNDTYKICNGSQALQLTGETYYNDSSFVNGAYELAMTPTSWNLSSQLWHIIYLGNGSVRLTNGANSNLALQSTNDAYYSTGANYFVGGCYKVAATPTGWNGAQQYWQIQ